MKRTLLALTLVGLCLGSTAARAQASAPVLAATEAPVDEVERGVFFGLDIGPSFITGAPAPSGGNSPFSTGATLRLEFGVDLGRHFSVSLFFAGTTYRTDADYVGASNDSASGDFSTSPVGWRCAGTSLDSRTVRMSGGPGCTSRQEAASPSSSPMPCSPPTRSTATEAFLCSADPGCSTTRAFDTFRWAWKS